MYENTRSLFFLIALLHRYVIMTNVNKNILFAVIVFLVIFSIGEGYFVLRERNEKIALSNAWQTSKMMMAKPTNRPEPMFVMKGQKFAQSPLFQKAYLIAPVTGVLPDDAKKALTGWNVKTVNNADGSTQVTLIPHEAEDVQQQFTLKKGYTLYFIEMTLVDDTTGVDHNRGDDIGVLVDENGIVQ